MGTHGRLSDGRAENASGGVEGLGAGDPDARPSRAHHPDAPVAERVRHRRTRVDHPRLRRDLLVAAGTVAAGMLVARLTARACGASEPSAPALEPIAKRVERTLIAPCCFSQTVAEHHSEVADEIRRRIREALAGGATGEQIVDELTRVYGERILAEPPARGFNLLAYLFPPLAALAGAGGLVLALRRWRRAASAGPSPQPPGLAGVGAAGEPLRARLAAELAALDR